MSRSLGAAIAVLACFLSVFADHQRAAIDETAFRTCQSHVIEANRYNIEHPLMPLPVQVCGPVPA